MNGNVFVYDFVALARTKLVKENEPKNNPKDFPNRREPSNELYTLL